jgi:hypothetical protein
LIGIVAVHFVFVPRFVVMHPGVKTRRVEDILTPFFFVREIDHVNDFNAHLAFSLTGRIYH